MGRSTLNGKLKLFVLLHRIDRFSLHHPNRPFLPNLPRNSIVEWNDRRRAEFLIGPLCLEVCYDLIGIDQPTLADFVATYPPSPQAIRKSSAYDRRDSTESHKLVDSEKLLHNLLLSAWPIWFHAIRFQPFLNISWFKPDMPPDFHIRNGPLITPVTYCRYGHIKVRCKTRDVPQILICLIRYVHIPFCHNALYLQHLSDEGVDGGCQDFPSRIQKRLEVAEFQKTIF